MTDHLEEKKIVLFIIVIVLSIISICDLCSIKFMPNTIVYLMIGMFVVFDLATMNILLGIKEKKVKPFQRAFCVLLSMCLLFGCTSVIDIQKKFERIFEALPEVSTLNMQVYTLAESTDANISDLVEKTMGIQTKYDLEHQNTAMQDINNQVSKTGEIKTVEYKDIYELLDALYNKKVDAILLTDDYANALSQSEEFKDFNDKTKSIYTVTQEIVDEHIRDAVPSMANTPFVMAIARNDTFPYDNIKNNTGRTDVNILMTVNPLVKKILLVTITRDSYVPINGELDKMDRLTNSSTFGVDAWENAIEYMMGVDINYFMRINFTAFTNLIDYFGGISFYNPDAFQARKDLMDGKTPGYIYIESGDITLNSLEALAYARERYPFPDGDFTRNRHDAIVMETLIKMISSKENLENIDKFLSAVEGTFITDVTMDDIYKLVKMQLKDNAEWTIETYGVTGEVAMDHSYTGGAGQGSEMMYVVYPDQDMINTARGKIESLLAEH